MGALRRPASKRREAAQGASDAVSVAARTPASALTAQSGLDCSVLKTLPGKTIILGTLDLSDMAIEAPESVAARIRRALPHVRAEQIVVAPDCGLKYLSREASYEKLAAMVEGAAIVRAEQLGGKS